VVDEEAEKKAALIEERKEMVEKICRRGDEMYDPWKVDADAAAAADNADERQHKNLNSTNASSTRSSSSERMQTAGHSRVF